MSTFVYKFIPFKLNSQFGVDKASLEEFLNSYNIDYSRVEIEKSNNIRFYDCGDRFESVVCPFCFHSLLHVWGRKMDKSQRTNFVQRDLTTTCCHKETKLEELVYYGDAGFAYEAVFVYNPSKGIDDIEISKFEKILGTEYKCVIAYY